MLNLLPLSGYHNTAPEIIVDLFAGGGGASAGMSMALGRDPDAAINHNPLAVAMHTVNHPDTVHFTEDVWSVSPSWVTMGRPVGLLWASPDCTHFSKAKGGAPKRDDRIRSLALVLVDKWIPETHPRTIIMENVEEFTTWGPLNSVTKQPIKSQAGDTFRYFIRRLRRAGYRVEWKELRACDYGAPTIRKRFFLIAKRAGQHIVWPEPTHGDPNSAAVKSGKLKPWKTAADCIDFSLPCPSIFESSAEIKDKYGIQARRPLADNTLRRIAKGIQKYVFDAADPFLLTYYGPKTENDFRGQNINEPLRTQTTENRHALIQPFLTEHANASSQRNFAADSPLRTQCAQVKGGHFALVSAFLAKHFTGVVGAPLDAPAPTVTTRDHNSLVTAHIERSFSCSRGNSVTAPLGTVTANGGGKCALVASNLVKMRGKNIGSAVDTPLHTVSAGGLHHAEVRAFLCKYYGQGVGQDLRKPIHTVTSKEHFGLITIAGQDYTIADIGMRMLTPLELFRAQGFPGSYIIDRTPDDKKLTKTDQVRMCGNSVCPPMAAALVAANCADMVRVAEVVNG
ncbi:DNA cytosine methyltransferase [Maridesulfovibrio ferrireducens]|uniref:DNA cytosine methyltransferase n=1 Tax=Maridesulfovibrio ferrireducens TaxID=246191 RepID=UPI001A2F7A74|nr:DNA cytosine methyltransferase [Maridesulfovibrio ferrireducens]MBI9112423.1 DNA cytosine methyltransferase [Maridesulfovibrio ferrireducens]